jgi:hypothetical protein
VILIDVVKRCLAMGDGLQFNLNPAFVTLLRLTLYLLSIWIAGRAMKVPAPAAARTALCFGLKSCRCFHHVVTTANV